MKPWLVTAALLMLVGTSTQIPAQQIPDWRKMTTVPLNSQTLPASSSKMRIPSKPSIARWIEEQEATAKLQQSCIQAHEAWYKKLVMKKKHGDDISAVQIDYYSQNPIPDGNPACQEFPVCPADGPLPFGDDTTLNTGQKLAWTLACKDSQSNIPIIRSTCVAPTSYPYPLIIKLDAAVKARISVCGADGTFYEFPLDKDYWAGPPKGMPSVKGSGCFYKSKDGTEEELLQWLGTPEQDFPPNSCWDLTTFKDDLGNVLWPHHQLCFKSYGGLSENAGCKLKLELQTK